MQKTTWHLSTRTIVLFFVTVLALVLCFTGTARAALQYLSGDYEADFALEELDVALMENDTVVEGDDALLQWLDKSTNIVPGKTYAENLAAFNNGAYDEYVRVVINKYWADDTGKRCDLDPSLIELEIVDGWAKDTQLNNNASPEHMVIYSTEILPVGESRAFVSSFKINSNILKEAAIEETIEGNTITTKYNYDGYTFVIEAEVDAVQTHNAADAVKSAWGIDPAIIGL